jgi:hypothetical protein
VSSVLFSHIKTYSFSGRKRLICCHGQERPGQGHWILPIITTVVAAKTFPSVSAARLALDLVLS